jgi:hypothetical protein
MKLREKVGSMMKEKVRVYPEKAGVSVRGSAPSASQ